MGIPVAIIGKPMSGKTYSIKSFAPDEVMIFSAFKGTLPFKGGRDYKVIGLNNVEGKDTAGLYNAMFEEFKNPKFKTYIVDDSQYLMSYMWAHATKDQQSFGKIYTDISKLWMDLLNSIRIDLPSDTTVYFLHHVILNEEGDKAMQTIGKSMDEKFQITGNFDIMLEAYKDETKNPVEYRLRVLRQFEEMFPAMDTLNNLKKIDLCIKNY